MNVQVRFVNHDRSCDSLELIRDILGRQLERFAPRLKQVQLYIEDVNGPRGGVDKECRCVLHLRRMSPIVISDADASVLAMVHRVADRASHALRRNMERQTEHRQPPRDQRPGRRAGRLNGDELQSLIDSSLVWTETQLGYDKPTDARSTGLDRSSRGRNPLWLELNTRTQLIRD